MRHLHGVPRRAAFAVLALACAAITLAACGSASEGARYAGTIEFPDVAVGSLVGGRVVRVWKQEGDQASAGEVLVALDPSEWKSRLDEAAALAHATERELALLQAGPRAEDIQTAKAEAKRAELLWKISTQGARAEERAAAEEEARALKATLDEAQKEVDRLTRLVRREIEPAAKLDAAQALREAAHAKHAVAIQHLRLLEAGLRPEEVEAARQAWLAVAARVQALEAGARPEEIAAKQATLEAAQARMRAAETTLRELKIVAPVDCVVQTLDVRAGDLLRPGVPVAVLLMPEKPWVVVYVPERELASVHIGQAARVLPDGHAPLRGRVTWISREAEYTPRNVQTRAERTTQVFAVKLLVEGEVSRLKDGMWTDVEFE